MPNGDRNRPREREPTGVVRPFALAVLVVAATALAGCGALAGGSGAGDVDTVTDASGPTPTATPGPSERLTEKLSAPPGTVFERAAAVAGLDPQEYPTLEFGEFPTGGEPDPFATQLVGPSPNGSADTDVVTLESVDTITVHEGRLERVEGPEIERQLVYAFFATEYYRNGWWELPDRPHDYAIIRASFRFITDAYGERHRPAVADPPAPYEETTLSDHEWVASGAENYYAYQWVADRADSPADATALIVEESPPSSEQFLADTDDEPMALGLALNTSESWYRGGEQNFRTEGPVVTRAVLRTELDAETAAGAAEGWGQDRFFVVQSVDRDRHGVVWAHRWDSPGDADEFEAAMTDYLDHRRNETDELRFEYRRLAPDVTLVVTGPPELTNATTVAYDTGNVTVVIGTDP
jgi:hypothetical protein